MTKQLKKNPKESFSKFFNLSSAMNFGRVIQNKAYKVNESWVFSQTSIEENLVMVEPSGLSTVEDIIEHMKKIRIILTHTLNLTETYKKIIEANEEIGYFRSIVVVTENDYNAIKAFLSEDPDIPGISSIDDHKSDHERFIDDLVFFGGFERAVVEKVLKGFEGELMSKKVSLISEHCKKEAEKKAKEEEQKKKDEPKKKEEAKGEDSSAAKDAPKEESKEESKASDTPVTDNETSAFEEPTLSTSESKVEEKPVEAKKEEKKDEVCFDTETIFGLEENDKLTANMTTLGTQES